MLDKIKAALLTCTGAVYHYLAPPNSVPPYVVWAEDGSRDFEADNRHNERAMSGTVDLYTLDDPDPLMSSIPEALDRTDAAWYLNSVQYEPETGLVHYEWVFEVA